MTARKGSLKDFLTEFDRESSVGVALLVAKNRICRPRGCGMYVVDPQQGCVNGKS